MIIFPFGEMVGDSSSEVEVKVSIYLLESFFVAIWKFPSFP